MHNYISSKGHILEDSVLLFNIQVSYFEIEN